jgi:thiamine kinase-like enzyme
MSTPLQRIIDQLPGCQPVSITPLPGGITNQNFRVDTRGEAFVVRIGGEDTHLLGIDRHNEYAANSIAAGLGVGPEVVGFFEAENALITRFIEGRNITAQEAAQPELLARIVSSIRRYHEGPSFPGTFNAFDTVRCYHTLAKQYRVAFPSVLPSVWEAMEEIERSFSTAVKLTPCHNDLLASNLMDDGHTVRIVDWEYAGMGDLFFDLGNFAVNQQLDSAECEFLLQRYFGDVRSCDLAHLHLMRLVSDLRESFWGFLQSGISKLDFDFRHYALEHLDRFLQNAAAPELPQWLQEVRR